ncbi:TIGR01212 family radical SAM protein [Anaerococcus sp. AGMB00486]|uniref:TIGR01212 family radical SAM protein n=2 Tax=Anaerococcus TaxID=165779 RepID=A0ABX2N7L2_9FIRM|nr:MULTISPECIES: TIGR01212 family radical SAM protein [Anaerococcus]MSS76856.1 TIGR01212 family radical SAM protein [Anaerococcus porci]NVF10660.1 TIGR01212 family radical SAM protein [Anaerococcus faecalis]
MSSILPYYPISEYYKNKYGQKVYKLPIKLSLTCPNRDGEAGFGGCIFCSESGGSFENLPSFFTVEKQLEINKNYIGSKYKVKKFIAYFQNFSNTYMDYEKFKEVICACNKNYIIAISISTRSDCITEKKLEFLEDFSKNTGIDIIIELGLQTANYKSLKILNRCEDLADFIKACNIIKKYNFNICTHVILSLPWDEKIDIIETARILNVLAVDEVKIHSLYIVKNTKLANMYKNNEFRMPRKEDYKNNVIIFLRYLNKNIAIQRLVGRAPSEDTIFCNWNSSWWVIRDEIIADMNENGFSQGDLSQKKKYNILEGE